MSLTLEQARQIATRAHARAVRIAQGGIGGVVAISADASEKVCAVAGIAPAGYRPDAGGA